LIQPLLSGLKPSVVVLGDGLPQGTQRPPEVQGVQRLPFTNAGSLLNFDECLFGFGPAGQMEQTGDAEFRAFELQVGFEFRRLERAGQGEGGLRLK